MRGEKTQARVDVETALQKHSSLTHPLSAHRIAELSGVDLALVRHYLGRFVGMNLVFNVGRRNKSAYVWSGALPREIPPSAPRTGGTYCGERQTYIAPERLKFLDVPSLSPTGERVPRTGPPMLMGASLE